MAKQTMPDIARTLRGRIITTSGKAGVPHLGSCLSCVDILVAAYFSVLRIDPSRPRATERDRFILSKGHGAPALIQTLALRGFFDEGLLAEYGVDGGILGEHPPTPDQLPGIEAATGSLGHGLPLGLGMAYAARLKGLDSRIYVLLGDGECNEGTVWEAAMLAPALGLDRIAVVVDYNKWQATDRSESVAQLAPLADKWRAFGWQTLEADGHDSVALAELMNRLPDASGKPLAIIAHTVKGKGVSFMEDDNNWHYRIPSADDIAKSLNELGLTQG